MSLEKETDFDPIPTAMLDADGEKARQGKRRSLVAEVLVYFAIISLFVIIYVNFVLSGEIYHFLLFHVFSELFSIVILGSIFIVGWNTRHIARNSFFLALGVSSLFVAVLDVLHTLAYDGMGFFTDVSAATNLAPQLWIASRYYQAISILVSLRLTRRHVKPFTVTTISFFICALLLTLIFTRNFPLAHDGTSLTPFKIVSEYLIIIILFICIFFTWKERNFFGEQPFKLVLAFLSTIMISEFCFTLYTSAYQFANMLGHVFKIISFAFAYKAIVQSVLEKPLDRLFTKLLSAGRDLEKRNRELLLANTKLQNEIADRKRAEITLRHFISSISHELRTPITVLDQSVQNLVNYSDRMSSEQETSLVSAISRNIRIMIDLVDNFANLNRIDDNKEELVIEPVDFEAIIVDVVNSLNNAIQSKEMILERSIDAGISFSGDASKIHAIIKALVDNALKFSPRGSSIVIRIIDHYTGEYNHDGKDGVLLQVTDNGIGIDADLLPRLFERFARSSRVQHIPGSGLGLAIIKNYVAMLGGKIYVATQVDKGTTFSLFLPHRKP
ncbi:MAG: MASE3 domain-containing protein [Candidatus Sigynarchaeota archaeon]